MKTTPQPPQWIHTLLRHLCKEHLLEEIEGDLLEFYEEWSKKYGTSRSNLLYLLHAIKFIRPYSLKKITHPFTSPIMFTNHLTVSVRQIVRSRGYAVLNVLSLSLGMVAFILIQIWVDFERSVDDFHEKEDKLYAVYYSAKGAEGTVDGYEIPINYKSPTWNLQEDFTDQIKGSIPGIARATEYQALYELPWGFPHTFRVGDTVHKIEGSVVEDDFLSMFSMDIIAGSGTDALSDPNQVVISERMSTLFFDSPSAAVGQTIRYEDRLDLVVSAVYADWPVNSSLQFEYLLSWKLMENNQIYRSSNQTMTFLLLEEATDPQDLQPLLEDFLDERLSSVMDMEVSLGIIPFGQKHLYSDFTNGKPQGGKIEYLNVFSWVGLFILALAAVNFSGLATARSVRRSKEIGVRKVIGSSRWQLITQFFVETFILSAVAVGLSLIVVYFSLPLLNGAIGLNLRFPTSDPRFWGLVAVVLVGTGALSGTYPAFYLASQRVSRMLKKDFKLSPSTVLFQKGLVIFQSFLATSMLLSTAVVFQQTDYIKNSYLGYERENIIYLPIEGALISKYSLFKDGLLEMPGIAEVDRASEAPHAMNFEVAEPINWQGKEPGQRVGFYPTSVGYNYIYMMKLGVAEGRGFSAQIASDSTAFMINEIAAKEMGIEDPIGKWISAWNKRGKIIGILKDYHINSLHQPIRPLIMDVKEDLEFGKVVVKTHPGEVAWALKSIEVMAKRLNPNYPVDIKFLDQEYEQMYRREATASSLANGFTTIAIIISCLGLVGLSVVAAEQRKKEMGIRKVLGASVPHLVGIFSRAFISLVAVATILSIPITTYFLRDWLERFAYHIDLTWYYFLSAILASLGLAFLSIAIQAIQTAQTDPVKTLKMDG